MSEIQSGKNLAEVAADLTDEEIKDTVNVINIVRARYAGKENTPQNLEALRDEVLTRLADIGVLATFDPAPCFYGDPPEVEIIGKVEKGHFSQVEFDHERKQYEVIEADKRGEDFRGQKEPYNKRKK